MPEAGKPTPNAADTARRGKVYLVGGGPGDPGLITLRGCQCLARADVVLYDYLVNPRILTHAPRAEKICLGRHGRDRIVSQEEINRQMVDFAVAGRVVVRLKGGDPAVFARAAEEVAALEAAGLEYEIVPGITAALASGSHSGIPITHGDIASAVALVTGQERPGKETSALDFPALAAFPGTLVFYMGVTTARQWSSALIAAGKNPSTPTAIVRRCSWPDQQTFVWTLDTVADELEARKLRPPVMVIVGNVVSLARATHWFSSRPLFGQTVLVTRPQDQSQGVVEALSELGAEVLTQPAIEISDPADWAPVDHALAELGRFDWLVFSSANGVRYFVERLLTSGRDMRAFGALKLAAIGPGTADELGRYHLKADLIPDEYRAEALAESLAKAAKGRRFLLARASRGREVLAEQLQAAGAVVEQVVVYTSRDIAQPEAAITEALAEGRIDWITVTSSAIARSLVAMFGRRLENCKLASISPLTSGVLREHGLAPAAEAREYTLDGLVQAIRETVREAPSQET